MKNDYGTELEARTLNKLEDPLEKKDNNEMHSCTIRNSVLAKSFLRPCYSLINPPASMEAKNSQS
jgi:hypothetical protein